MIFIDFEYNQPQEQHMGLVCCSLFNDSTGQRENYWLHNAPESRWELARYLVRNSDQVMCAYGASAEARCFLALGLNPMGFRWLDLYAEWRCLKMNNNKHSYGRYLRRQPSIAGGKIQYKEHGYSVPPSLNPKDNEGKDNTEIGNGLVDCVYHLMGINLDAQHKEQMRKIILSRPEEFRPEDQKAIMEYCQSDITHLPELRNILADEICGELGLKRSQYREIAVNRGRYCAAAIATVEHNGIPFDIESANNLSRNVRKARLSLLAAYSKQVELPFYAKEKPTRKVFSGRWVEKYGLFEEYIRSKPQYADWPLTDAGQLSRENDVLKENDGDPNIAAYRQVRKTLRGLQSFDPKSKSAKESGIVMDAVGEDNRLRTMFGVMGTQTGRNAPRARKFPFAMGSWARSLIRPPDGEIIVSIDWVSQENAIQALLSEDMVLWEAYQSGDPYLFFAKRIGLIPPDGTKKTHPRERGIAKIVLLGISYGMGVVKLSKTLTTFCGREVTEKETARIISQHKRLYHQYWKWSKRVGQIYERQGYLMLKDGFALMGNCNRMTSVRNFPIQGTGAIVLRRATVLAVERGVPVISPLHDALYACGKGKLVWCTNEQGKSVATPGDDDARMLIEGLSKAMTDACIEVLGVDIGQDVELHDNSHPWVEDGAEVIYGALSPYYEMRESEVEKRLKQLSKFYWLTQD